MRVVQRRLAAGIAFGTTLLVTFGVAQGILTFPSADCAGTLQACIDAAGAGDTIAIALDTLVDEDLTIQKSLTLTIASGFTGGIGNEGSEPDSRFLTIRDTVTSGPIDVVLNGLRFDNTASGISFTDSAAGGHRVEMRQCNAFLLGSTGTTFVGVDVRVPASVVLRRNTIRSTGDVISFFTALTAGPATLTVDGNTLSATAAGAQDSVAGVEIRPGGAGTVTANIVNNVVDGVGGCHCGGAAGIFALTTGSVSATVSILHNTFDDIDNGAPGIDVFTPGQTSQLTVNLFNNIMTRVEGRGIRLPAASPQLVINNDSNDFYFNSLENDFGGYVPGPNTVSVDPLYQGSGNFRLRAGSPVLDAGTSAPPGGLPTFDADGNPRLVGGAPDLGAYESAAGVVATTTTSTPTTSTTSTTLAPDPCAPAATFASVACRLGALREQAEDQVGDGRLSGKLGSALTKAKGAVRLAEQLAAEGKAKPARRALAKALRALARFRGLLGSVPSPLRDTLLAGSNAIAADVGSLRGG